MWLHSSASELPAHYLRLAALLLRLREALGRSGRGTVSIARGLILLFALADLADLAGRPRRGFSGVGQVPMPTEDPERLGEVRRGLVAILSPWATIIFTTRKVSPVSGPS